MLLDTHAIRWVLDGGADLGEHARAAIAGDDDPCFSPVSIAEISINQMLGTLLVPADFLPPPGRTALREMPFLSSAADRLVDWSSLVHHGPFDRLLLARAAAAGSTLVTADRVLVALQDALVLDARSSRSPRRTPGIPPARRCVSDDRSGRRVP